jgi:hypothetical protein
MGQEVLHRPQMVRQAGLTHKGLLHPVIGSTEITETGTNRGPGGSLDGLRRENQPCPMPPIRPPRSPSTDVELPQPSGRA